jgi:hypothetical protein
MGFYELGMQAMVKRIKQEDMAGALELEGIGKDDPRLQRWLEEHRGRNGGKGVRVMFARDADLHYWRLHYQLQTAKAAA